MQSLSKELQSQELPWAHGLSPRDSRGPVPFGPTGTHGRVSVLGCLQTAGLQPGGFLPPAAGLVFKGLISKSHICTSGSELWYSFNTVHNGDPDFSVKTLDLLFSLSSELCHDFPRPLDGFIFTAVLRYNEFLP